MKFFITITLLLFLKSVNAQIYFRPDSIFIWSVDTGKVDEKEIYFNYMGYLKNRPFDSLSDLRIRVFCDSLGRVFRLNQTTKLAMSEISLPSNDGDFSFRVWMFGDSLERAYSHNEIEGLDLFSSYSLRDRKERYYRDGKLNAVSEKILIDGNFQLIYYCSYDEKGKVDYLLDLDHSGQGYEIEFNDGIPYSSKVYFNFIPIENRN